MDSVLLFLKKVDKVNKTCMLILIVFSKENTVMFSRIWVRIWKREKILQLKILFRSFWLKCKSVKKRQKLFVCIETNCDSVQKKGFRRWYMYQTRKKMLRIMDWSPYLHILKPFENCLYKSWYRLKKRLKKTISHH